MLSVLDSAVHAQIQVDRSQLSWLTIRQQRPDLAARPYHELLHLARELPGNFRYVPVVSGGIDLMGEVLSEEKAEAIESLLERLLRTDPKDQPTPTEEEVESALDASGMVWSRRENNWVVPLSDGVLREVQVSVEPGGVGVEAILIEWDETTEQCREALAQYLFRAQAQICFARCELVDQRACVVSHVASGEMEQTLRHVLHGVGAACRSLARESRALLVPELAQQYLQFQPV